MSEKPNDIVLIRHAESLFNEATWKHANELGLSDLAWMDLLKHKEFVNRVPFNKLWMDPPISERGVKQV